MGAIVIWRGEETGKKYKQMRSYTGRERERGKTILAKKKKKKNSLTDTHFVKLVLRIHHVKYFN